MNNNNDQNQIKNLGKVIAQEIMNEVTNPTQSDSSDQQIKTNLMNGGTVVSGSKSYHDVISEGKEHTIEAVRMSGTEIDLVRLEDGTILDKQSATEVARAGLIKGVVTANSSTGESYMRSTPDGDPSNNLRDLPKF